MNEIQFMGKVIIAGNIVGKTGLHIGGASTGLEIGGVDNVVVRDPVTNLPYIPGSSLKGKMRSLLEKYLGKVPNKSLGENVKIHECKTEEEYVENGKKCVVCRIFGIAGEASYAEPTRLIVRDANISEKSKVKLEKASTDLPYTEVKWEAVIDRITSAAMPRQTERVPAGSEFEFEMIYNIFDKQDKDNLKKVFEAMSLLEQDYLGGQGSRGYGKVKFENIKIFWNSKSDYETGNSDVDVKNEINRGYNNVMAILQNFGNIIGNIQFKEREN